MVYQIFADEVLGSGQFGVVYGGKCVCVCVCVCFRWRTVVSSSVFPVKAVQA